MLLPSKDRSKLINTLGLLLPLAVWAFSALPAAGAPAAGEQPGQADDADEGTEAPARQAFKLGDFRIKNFRPVEREKVTMEFTVFIEVPAGHELRYEQLRSHYEHRIRNQIITSARLVPPNEFDDPTLHALRRRIYLRLRRAVPELPVAAVFISDFSYILE